LGSTYLTTTEADAVKAQNFDGFAWLGLIGAVATYAVWFRGVARLEPGSICTLGMMRPQSAFHHSSQTLKRSARAP
jgi:probable blue pigment (indigoidine) exporter